MLKRQPKPQENKLLILYLIKAFGQLDDAQINRYVVEMDLMGYMELHLLLGEMKEAGLVVSRAGGASGEGEGRFVCALSPSGVDTLSMFLHHIPASRRDLVDASVSLWIERFKKEQQFAAEWSKAASGDYIARLRVLEGSTTLIDLSLSVVEPDQARLMTARWETRSSAVYKAIMDVLLTEDEPPPEQA